jgi:hypothetical protein
MRRSVRCRVNADDVQSRDMTYSASPLSTDQACLRRACGSAGHIGLVVWFLLHGQARNSEVHPLSSEGRFGG